MSTLLTRMFRDRCTACQVGQGRGCACRNQQRKRRSWCINMGEFWRLYLALVVGILGALVWWGCS